jgi:nicotinic acid phosphoribosyltransferase
MNHNGTLLIRGDSGNPVDILAGKKIEWLEDGEIDFSDSEGVRLWMRDFAWDYYFETNTVRYFHQNGKFYEVTFEPDWQVERGGWTDIDYEYIDTYHITWKEIEPTAELLGTVWALDQIVGHTVNEKGYKVLDPHLRAIYGDSIIPDYADEAYRRLEAQGYAANNIVMGAGSMSMMALVCENNGQLCFAGKVNGTNPGPYTRDTFGYAIKATYGEDENGNPVMIQKQPKALSWKKSPKGCIVVAPDGQSYTDGWTYEEAHGEGVENLLECVFRNGEMVKETTLAEVRNRMWSEGF